MTTSLEPTRTSALLSSCAAAAAWAGTVTALRVADGVVRVRRDTYTTEFIQGPLFLVTAALALVLVGAAAWWSWRWAAGGLLASVAALTWGGTESVQRSVDSGWGDGLEVLIYVVPVGVAVAGLVLVALVGRLGRRSSRVGGAAGR